jgi:anti-anti-sigma factor
VQVTGELDLATSPQLHATLIEAQGQARVIIVDLRGVTFIDSSGLYVLLEADQTAKRTSGRVVFIRGSTSVDRLFTIAGIAETVEVVDLNPSEPPQQALLRIARSESRR